MFVCSLKASRIKAFALTMLCAVVLGGALTLILGKAGRSEDLAAAAFSERNIKFDEIKNSQDLENFIASLGMEVKTRYSEAARFRPYKILRKNCRQIYLRAYKSPVVITGC